MRVSLFAKGLSHVILFFPFYYFQFADDLGYFPVVYFKSGLNQLALVQCNINRFHYLSEIRRIIHVFYRQRDTGFGMSFF